jgi:hypothetical protein
MRHRETTSGAFDVPEIWEHYTRSSCAVGFTANGTDTSYSGTVDFKSIDDVVTPKFLSLRQCGAFLPLNPVDIITQRTEQTAGSGTHYVNFTGGCWRNYHTGSAWWLRPWLLSVPADDTDIINDVANGAIAEARQAIFDITTNIGEMQQTANMLKDNINRVLDFADKAARKAKNLRPRKGKPVTEADRWRAFFSFWLEYRYGWRPLIGSIQDLVKALENKREEGFLLEGHASQWQSLDDTVVGTWKQDSDRGTGMQTEFLLGSRTYRGSAYATVNFLGNQWGRDPIVSTWELIPWSFVIDWFINIGDWVNSISPFAGGTFKGSCVSIKDEYTLSQTFGIAWSGGTGAGAHSGSFGQVATEITIQRYTRFPHSGGLPGWNPRLTTARLADIAALVATRLLGIRRTLR